MALLFDTTGERIERTVNIPTGGFTWMAWVFHNTSFSTWETLLHRGDTSSTEHYLGANNGVLKSEGGGSGSTLSSSTWYHLAVFFANGTQLVYINGAQDISTTAGLVGTITHLAFGGSSWFQGQVWNGRMAAIKMWRTQLSPAEILNESRCYLPIITTNIDTVLPCIGSIVADNGIDISGNGYNMTPIGTLSIADGPPIPWRIGRRRRVYAPGAVPPVSFVPGRSLIFQAVQRAVTY